MDIYNAGENTYYISYYEKSEIKIISTSVGSNIIKNNLAFGKKTKRKIKIDLLFGTTNTEEGKLYNILLYNKIDIFIRMKNELKKFIYLKNVYREENIIIVEKIIDVKFDFETDCILERIIDHQQGEIRFSVLYENVSKKYANLKNIIFNDYEKNIM